MTFDENELNDIVYISDSDDEDIEMSECQILLSYVCWACVMSACESNVLVFTIL